MKTRPGENKTYEMKKGEIQASPGLGARVSRDCIAAPPAMAGYWFLLLILAPLQEWR